MLNVKYRKMEKINDFLSKLPALSESQVLNDEMMENTEGGSCELGCQSSGKSTCKDGCESGGKDACKDGCLSSNKGGPTTIAPTNGPTTAPVVTTKPTPAPSTPSTM